MVSQKIWNKVRFPLGILSEALAQVTDEQLETEGDGGGGGGGDWPNLRPQIGDNTRNDLWIRVSYFSEWRGNQITLWF